MITENVVTVPGGLISPDDFSLISIEIISASGNIDIRGLMVELSYYEDIFRGSMSGEILLSDSISLIDTMGLNGSEFLRFSFKKTNQSSTTINKYFRIYRVSERIIKSNNSELYKLHFCSEELFLSEQIKISKSYSAKTITDIVYNILTEELKIPKDKLYVYNTKGMYDFIIPYKKPFEAINWLSNYARPIFGEGADFVFFENVDGFNFVSLQELFKQEAYAKYIYSIRNYVPSDSYKELGISLVGIKSYNILDTFDTLYGTSMGAFANRVLTIDPLTRTYRDTKFDYEKYIKRAETLNKGSIISNQRNRLGKTFNENYDAVFKVLTSNSDQKKAVGISDNPQSVGNDIYAETYVPNRTAQLALAHYSRIKLAVSGDPNITVGTVVDLVLPSMRSKDSSGNNDGTPDDYHSGKYLITSVRHLIDVNFKYETVIEAVKDSFGAKIPSFNNNGQNINNTVKNAK